MENSSAKCCGCGVELPVPELIELDTDGIHEYSCVDCHAEYLELNGLIS